MWFDMQDRTLVFHVGQIDTAYLGILRRFGWRAASLSADDRLGSGATIMAVKLSFCQRHDCFKVHKIKGIYP